MGTRLELQTLLEGVLGSGNVYFQPPENIRMNYPAIVYSRNRIENTHADNRVYKQSLEYELTVIYKDADSDLPLVLSQLPMCRHDRHFKSDNLNHDVFTLYF